jgi:hypothetical protein
MSTLTSECIKTIAKCIKMRPKSSKFSRKSQKSFQKFLPKSEKLNRQIHSQIQDRTPTSRDINEFQNHHEKLSKIKNHKLPSGSMYFLTIFEHNFFLIIHHGADFILVFYPHNMCPTPPSCREKEKIIKQHKNVRCQKIKKITTSEAGLSPSGASENYKNVVARLEQSPAQVPLEVESDPTTGCRKTLFKCEGAAMQNRCQKAGKTTTKIKTITNKKGRENSKLPELPDGVSTEIANKLQKQPKNSETDGNTTGNAVDELLIKINRKRARKFKSPNNNNQNVYKYKSITMTMTFKNPMTIRPKTSSNRNPIVYKPINMTPTLNMTLRLTLTLSGNNNINVYQYKTIYVTLTLRPMTSENIADINCAKLVPSSTLGLTSGLALRLTLKSTFTHNAIWCMTSAPVFSKETTKLTGDKKSMIKNTVVRTK